jgi:hypothetical protein
MELSQIYILISILALFIIAIILFFVRKDKKGNRLSILGGLGLIFVLGGIIFGESKLVAYSLMGIGVLLAVIDMFIKLKKRK